MDRSIPPAQISPLIKAARWGFLLTGIMYGASRYSVLHNKEVKRLEELERTRPEREAKAKLEREKLAKEQIEDLQKQLGVSM